RSEKPAEQEPETRQDEVAVVPPATDEQLGPIDRSESAAEAAPADESVEPQYETEPEIAPGQRSDALAEPEAAEAEEEPQPKTSWFQRLKAGLTKTSSKLSEGITGVFAKRKLDASTLEELEDLLIQADLGLETAARITDALEKGRYDKGISPEEVR